jgi:uncharacterized protein (TIGR04255 family)
MSTQNNPLAASLPTEVPLPGAPLVRVIVQVRFPSILSIEKRDFVAPFQEVIRKSYPVLRAEQTRGILLGPDGPAQMLPTVTWRFTSADEKWRVSLATDFVAIETTAYESRTDLLGRFEEVVRTLESHIAPQTVDRLGVRYIDRITGASVDAIDKLVRTEMLGVAGTAAGKHANLSISEALFDLPDHPAQMRARWGLLPAGGTVDPAAVEPIDERSWILDLDIFSLGSRPFESAKILSETRIFAGRSYSFFRWAVTDDFLRLYGGKV